jgi:oligoendopeptidase F
MNYQGKSRDVMTLAHELGHGVHQVLAAPLGPLLAPTPLTLAETASVFGEMLTFKALLASSTDPKERKALLAQKVEDMINTVVRQIAFYGFERRVHQERRSGELTAERLGQIWLEVQGESLGPAIDLGWIRTTGPHPHFIHSPFYVYAYAGIVWNSLLPALGPSRVRRQILRDAGRAVHTTELLPFSLDARRAFWRGLK